MTLNVYVDRRWPAGSGIGVVMRQYEKLWPNDLSLHDLNVRGRIGSPLSPFWISKSLVRTNASQGVYWSPGFVPPLFSNLPSVVTVNDLTHLHFYSALHRLYYSAVYLPLFRRCEHIVCCSHYSRQEFLNWSGIDPAKVSVNYYGAPPLLPDGIEAWPNEAPYLLYPGNHRDYKNLRRMIRAFAVSSLPALGFDLVLTGRENPSLRQLAVSLGVSHRLKFTGFLEDHELIRCYKSAHCMVFVSLYEGFGLPILEGMAANVPVITSNCSAMPEIAGDAAVIVDPYSVDDIAAAMEKVCTDADLAGRLRKAGRARVAEFSWDKSATSLFSLLRAMQ